MERSVPLNPSYSLKICSLVKSFCFAYAALGTVPLHRCSLDVGRERMCGLFSGCRKEEDVEDVLHHELLIL